MTIFPPRPPKKVEFVWRPTPKQREFLACGAREALWGGAAGAGKSAALIAKAAEQVDNGRHSAILFRRSFPMLRDLIAASHEVYRPLGATFRVAERQWVFPSGARVEFGYLDGDADKYRYQGREFSFIGWDELTQWPGDAEDAQGNAVNGAYLYLLSRLRAPKGSGLRLRIRATSNPGGVGSHWVQARFGIPDDGGASEVADPATGFRRAFIPGRIADNPYLAGTDYERSLNALSEAERKTLRDGRWDAFQGSVFSEWNPRVHVCDAFAIPDGWEQWRGADDGYAAPACVLWAAHDKVQDVVYITNELYQLGMTAEVMARRVKAIDGTRQLGGVIDSAAFQDTGQSAGGGGRANVMNAHGCRWVACEKGPGSRVAGIASIHQRLALRADGTPGLRVFRGCANLIRTLPRAPYSETELEDIDKKAERHALDALAYLLQRKKPTRTALGVVRFGS